MKVRTSFVSNSSTTSFVIAIIKEDPEVCPHCGRGGTNLRAFLDNHNHYESSLDWDDVEDKLGQLYADLREAKEQGWDCDAECIREEISRLKAAQEQWPQIIGVDVSYHDDLLNAMIEQMEKAGEIKILDQ